MAYYLDLFSPETHERFSTSDRSLSGFRERHRVAASRVEPGDILICYLTRLSRWVGLLRVETKAFEDPTPIFTDKDDPFFVRFKVTPLVWLTPVQGVPIHEDPVWTGLSFTRGHAKNSGTWTGFIRTSLKRIADDDGRFLEDLLTKSQRMPVSYPLSDDDRRRLRPRIVRRPEGTIAVSVPEEGEAPGHEPDTETRESIRIQALLARIGAAMGFKIWLPAGDRAAVLRAWTDGAGALVDALPLSYDDVTLATVERIDMIWLRGRAIVRAFEVEHTTAIYSGLLRMADLLSLQPNMDIKLHIVAPEARREKVLEEIRRPVFSLLQRPLCETCTFLSYDSVREIDLLPHLSHTAHTIIDEYGEEATE